MVSIGIYRGFGAGMLGRGLGLMANVFGLALALS